MKVFAGDYSIPSFPAHGLARPQRLTLTVLEDWLACHWQPGSASATRAAVTHSEAGRHWPLSDSDSDRCHTAAGPGMTQAD